MWPCRLVMCFALTHPEAEVLVRKIPCKSREPLNNPVPALDCRKVLNHAAGLQASRALSTLVDTETGVFCNPRRSQFYRQYSGVGELEKDSPFSAFGALLYSPERLAQSCAELFRGSLGKRHFRPMYGITGYRVIKTYKSLPLILTLWISAAKIAGETQPKTY